MRKGLEKSFVLAAAIASVLVLTGRPACAEVIWSADVTVSVSLDSQRLTIGAADNATDGFENAYETRAVLTGDLMAYFYHPEWGVDTSYFWSDIRDAALPEEWVFYVSSSRYTNTNIAMSWTLDAPETLELYLVDDTAGVTVDMKAQDSYIYLNTSTLARSFTVHASGDIALADTTPPADVTGFTVTNPGTGNRLNLSWTNPADSDFAGVKVVRAAGAPAPSDCSGTAIYTGAGTSYADTPLTENQQYSYRICSYDGVPNYSVGVTGSGTPADTTPPETSIIEAPPAFMASSTAEIRYTGTDNITPTGALEFSYRVDSGGWSAWSRGTTAQLNGLSEAAHTFRVKAKDGAGNEDPTPAELSFTVDTTRPGLTLNKPQPQYLWPSTGSMVDVTVSGRVTETGSGLTSLAYEVIDEYRRFGSAGSITPDAGGNFSFRVSLQAWKKSTDRDGRLYTIRVRAADRAGNEGMQETWVRVLRSPTRR